MRRFAVIALAGVAAGAMAQDRPESILPPGFDQPTPAPTPTPPPPPPPRVGQNQTSSPEDAADDVETGDATGEVAASDELDGDDRVDTDGADPGAREMSALVGAADFGDAPWGATRGAYLTSLLRDMDAPLALRWGHIALRNALIAAGNSPSGVSDADWVAERAWLLLRMGEADAARLLVGTVPKSQYSPKLTQVSLQTALATSDPAAMCPPPSGFAKVEATAQPLVDAICAALSGQPEIAADAINRVRRRGTAGGIDVSLTDKLVGAGSSTARAVTLEWEPVTDLTSWRYGLATATGVALPDRLYADASIQLKAWNARAPLLTPAQRLPSARVATGLGVFSGQALVDLYSLHYDSSDADDLAGSDTLTLRRAFVGGSLDERMDAMRTIWNIGDDDLLERRASYAMLGRGASRMVPNADFVDDAPRLVASMLAMGLDDGAARWVRILDRIGEDEADPIWAQLALGAPDISSIDLTRDRVDDFGSRDDTTDKWRTRLLIAGLAGLGRIDAGDLSALGNKYRLGAGRDTKLVRDLGDAAERGDAATVVLLSAVTMQTASPENLPPYLFYHAIKALHDVGQDYFARMIAAEALAPA